MSKYAVEPDDDFEDDDSYLDDEPDQYWSGTGESMDDDSYIDYLNRW